MILMVRLDDVHDWGMNVDGKWSWHARELWMRGVRRGRDMVWFLRCWVLSVSNPPWVKTGSRDGDFWKEHL